MHILYSILLNKYDMLMLMNKKCINLHYIYNK